MSQCTNMKGQYTEMHIVMTCPYDHGKKKKNIDRGFISISIFNVVGVYDTKPPGTDLAVHNQCG